MSACVCPVIRLVSLVDTDVVAAHFIAAPHDGHDEHGEKQVKAHSLLRRRLLVVSRLREHLLLRQIFLYTLGYL